MRAVSGQPYVVAVQLCALTQTVAMSCTGEQMAQAHCHVPIGILHTNE